MNPNPHPPQSPEPVGPPPGTPYGGGGQAYPPPYGAYAQQPSKFGGALWTLRIMMFVGGVVGVLIAILFTALGMDDDPIVFLAAAVFGLYGVGSLVLAVLAKRRSPAIRWTILAFHILALAWLVFTSATAPSAAPGEPDPAGSFRSMTNLFTIVSIILICLPSSGRYFRNETEWRPAPFTPGGYGPPPSSGYAKQPPASGQVQAAPPTPGGYAQQQYPPQAGPDGYAQQPPAEPPGGYGPPQQ